MEIVYSPVLVILSVLVAIFASYVALNLAYSVTQARGRAQVAWLLCGSVAMGVGIWSMHFVGMLAFEMPDMEMAYDVPLMVLSVVVAILGSALALFVVSRPVVTLPSLIASGIAMAAAISGMHYIGMYSMRMEASIIWNYYLVALSIFIALGASFAALMIAIRLRHSPDRVYALLVASILMGFAISGMHYTGMIAATFVHDHSAVIEDTDLLVTSGLSIATISTTLLILGIALIGSVGQRMMASRQKKSEAILGTSEEKYRVLVEAVKDYAIFMLNPKGFIMSWNKGAERLTGYQQQEIVGKHVSKLYGKEDEFSDVARLELTKSRETGHFEGEALRMRKNGTQFWANIVLDPLFDSSGQVTGFSKVLRDITPMKKAEERSRSLNEELEKRVQERTLELQKREAQLRTITNAIPTLVAQLDAQERFLFANDAFCEWFQRSRDAIQTFTFRDLLGEDRYLDNKPYIDRVLNGETVSYERLSVSGQRQASLNITFVPEFDDKRNVSSFIVVAADVSNYKRIEAELKSAKEAAEVANETKSAFLANMSHEIRTPLGAVIGFSELMLEGDLSPSEKANTLEIIKRNGKLLSTIINDILDLSKVEAGRLEVERIEVPLMDLVNEITVLLNLEASGKGVQLSVSREGRLPRLIKTDPTRLRQILFNIVGNAVKFTEKGSINVTVKLCEDDANQVCFLVKDTGTGIAPEQAQRLFSPFVQADVTTTRRFGGTGLGLVLSKKLAQLLGGDVILANSALGEGSTFEIRIHHGQPLASVSDSGGGVSKVSSAAPTLRRDASLQNHKILVVDDSPDNLALMKRILNLAGAEVDTASNGSEGIQRALSGDYSSILMDLQMPEMDGYEATRALRSKGYRRPIIALTAHAMKEERKRCLESGFNDHLTKPVDREALIHILSEYRS
ncbi:MAG: PAS domain S-box protein [Bdellovibrionaceae bacterium]|nr:PAS domain S-box protein [Pseudobdellovibrionaceae bacterium]